MIVCTICGEPWEPVTHELRVCIERLRLRFDGDTPHRRAVKRLIESNPEAYLSLLEEEKCR